MLLQFIKAQEAQISRMNDKAETQAVNKIINQFKKATPLYVELVELIDSRFKTAKADMLPTEPHQKLINELNTPIESFLVYTLPTGKRKAKRTDPSWKRDNIKKRIYYNSQVFGPVNYIIK